MKVAELVALLLQENQDAEVLSVRKDLGDNIVSVAPILGLVEHDNSHQRVGIETC